MEQAGRTLRRDDGDVVAAADEEGAGGRGPEATRPSGDVAANLTVGMGWGSRFQRLDCRSQVAIHMGSGQQG